MNQIKIGKYLAEKRNDKKLLQKDVAAKLGISEKTVSKWECGNGLPDAIYMEPLCTLLGITVNEMLLGEDIPIMKMLQLLDRSYIELVQQLEFEQLKMRIYKLYDIEIDSMEISSNGAGGLAYFITAGDDKYVIKYPSENEINNPDIEISVCEILLNKGVPVCRFIANKQGKMISTDELGRRFTLQYFYEGITYEYNSAPVSVQKESVTCLANIHNAMKEIEDVPVGIGEEFIKYRTVENTVENYKFTLQKAMEEKNQHVVHCIETNIEIIRRMKKYKFDIKRFSIGPTHGDYMISQLIWKDNKINGIIDWTCTCKHPYIWEIVRSYVFMAPEVAQGKINMDVFIDYIAEYMKHGTLNAYDIKNAGNFFFYFLAVCDFYGQYYDSISLNRDIYLKQADMASDLLVWFDQNIDELNDKLKELSLNEEYRQKMKSYYDSQGRLSQYPTKQPMRIIALQKIAGCFSYNMKYTEKKVNEIIRENISFSDVELIRRELFQHRFIGRLKDGSEYWREKDS